MISDEALKELKTILRGLVTEDGHDFVNDMVIWADEHGDELIAELDRARERGDAFVRANT